MSLPGPDLLDPLPEWSGARRVLCVRLDSLGDVLMTTPAIRAIKESLPGCNITLLTSAAGAAPAPMIPEIDGVMTYASPWMKASPERASSQLDRALIDELRGRQFDAAVIFTVFSQNPLPAALTCYLADIPLRLAHCRENPYHLLTGWVKEIEPERGIRHEVQRQLDLVASAGFTTRDTRLSLRVPAAARASITSRLARAGISFERPWLVIHPGVSAPSRQYSPEKYARAARELAEVHGFQVVFSGSEAEAGLAAQIQQAMQAPSISLAGQLTLEELCALIEATPVLVTNNTGPVHIAAAVGTPVVDLYALTNPQHTPWQVPHLVLNQDVPCKYCYKSICPEGHHHCLELVPPQAVIDAVLELISRPSEARRP